jgi:phospholipid/cholesterol/gamma-HCH transport system permease protein
VSAGAEAEGDAPEDEERIDWREVLLEALRPLYMPVLGFFAEIGIVSRLLFEVVMWAVRPPYRPRQLIDALEFIGVQSIFIVGLTGFFVGGVFGLQLVDGFRQFGAESQVGPVVALALSRELAPVFSALMITSRAGSAIATEIASMRVTNQIDALTTMSVNPVQYLVAPRVIAGVVACPVMSLMFLVIGFGGAYTVAVLLLNVDGGIFVERARYLVDTGDVVQGLVKAAFFGGTLTLISCRQGYHASGGAAGVGRATNRAVVQSAVAILVLDYILTGIILGQGIG